VRMCQKQLSRLGRHVRPRVGVTGGEDLLSLDDGSLVASSRARGTWQPESELMGRDWTGGGERAA
jgi:hypothetical protein